MHPTGRRTREPATRDGGPSVKFALAAWLIVMFCPATVMTPVRGVIPGFCATAYPTGAIPVPDEPCVKVSQGALLVPCQAQPLELATKVNNPVPPAPSAESVVVVGEMPNAHGAVPSLIRARNACPD